MCETQVGAGDSEGDKHPGFDEAGDSDGATTQVFTRFVVVSKNRGV